MRRRLFISLPGDVSCMLNAPEKKLTANLIFSTFLNTSYCMKIAKTYSLHEETICHEQFNYEMTQVPLNKTNYSSLSVIKGISPLTRNSLTEDLYSHCLSVFCSSSTCQPLYVLNLLISTVMHPQIQGSTISFYIWPGHCMKSAKIIA